MDDGFIDMLGEQTRGGGQISLSGDQAVELLGEMAAKSPALNNYLQQRVANASVALRQRPINRWRDWYVTFGPVSGTASTITTVTKSPQVHFRGEKVMATDDGGSKSAGYNTRVGVIQIGQQNQSPVGSDSTLTYFFANGSLGNGVKWDTCEKALSISVTVSFVTTSTFEMTVFGKAALM